MINKKSEIKGIAELWTAPQTEEIKNGKAEGSMTLFLFVCLCLKALIPRPKKDVSI